MQYAVLSEEALTTGSVMKFDGPFYQGSLAEPLSCILSAFRRQQHFREGTDRPFYGLIPGGVTVIMGIGGPMGRGMNLMAMYGVEKPGVIIGTEVDEAVIERFQNWFPQDEYRKLGIKFELVNPKKQNLREIVMKCSNGRGADDVFSMVTHQLVFSGMEGLLGGKRRDSPCTSLFAGPEDEALIYHVSAKLWHYGPRTYTVTKCGTIESMEHVLAKISHGQLDPARMIIAVQGLDTAKEMVENMPQLSGKNLVYNHIRMPRVEIDKFKEASQQSQEPYKTIFRELAVMVAKNNGVWGANCEEYLLTQEEIRLKPRG